MLIFCRENEFDWDGSESLKMDRNDSDANEDLKRKYIEATPGASNPNTSPQKSQGGQAPTPRGRNSNKKQKHGKLDWNVLRPPKPQNK